MIKIKIGDWVELLTDYSHNSSHDWFKTKEYFDRKDVHSIIQILNIDGNTYKVKTPTGITALRRNAFEKVNSPYKIYELW